MKCKCGRPLWEYGTTADICCSERLLRAMPTRAALYLLQKVEYPVSKEFLSEYRQKWREQNRATRISGNTKKGTGNGNEQS